MATSKEIKETLVVDYGYKRNDFLNPETGKDYTYKKLESMLKEEKEKEKSIADDSSFDSELNEFDKDVVKAKSKSFDDNDLVTVMSGVNGKLIHYSSVGNGSYTFNGFGQQQEMPYKELRSINNLKRKIFEDGLIIILNKEIISEFRLAENYKHILTPSRVDELLKLNANEIVNFLEKASKDTQLTFLDIVKVRYNVGSLDSMSIIKAIEKHYGISLDDNLASLQ